VSFYGIIEGEIVLLDENGDQAGIATNPLRVDPTGETAQPITVSALPLPSGAATDRATAAGPFAVRLSDGSGFIVPTKETQLPAALVGGRLDANLGAWLGSTAPSVGQKTMAASVPVVVASDQSAIRVGGRADNGSAPDGYPVLAAGSDGALVRTIKTDTQGRLVTVPAGSSSTHRGFADGKVVLSATTPVPIYATTYTEQTSNAQRSLVSSSASDAAAGTGARTVRVTYLTSAGVGPLSEVVTLNGTAAVNMIATDVCFVEKIEVVTVGSGGTNAGTISLKAATAGGGATVWSIAIGDGRTFGSHHYVPTAHVCRVTGVHVGIKGADTSSFYLKAILLPASGNFEEQVGDLIRVASSAGFLRTYGTPIEIVGPARVSVWAAPDSTSSRTYYGSFDYYDEDVT
jgi:hypothetical protein